MPQMIFDDEDGTFGLLRDSVSGFAADFHGPTRMRARRAAGSDLDRDLWAAMADAGWLGLSIPEELGGSGLGPRAQAVLSEALGRELISEPLAFLAVFSGALLSQSDESAARARLIEGLIDGSLVVTPAVQGVDGALSPLKAVATQSGLSLSGEAHFVNAAASSDELLVLAAQGDEVLLVAVPRALTTVTLRPTLDGAQLGRVALENAEISADRILSRQGLTLAEAAVNTTRLALAAELAGNASKALEITVGYTSERVQFGKPIAAFQSLQHRMVDMWADAEFACSAVVNACDRQDEGDALAAHLSILAAKARAGDAAVTVGRRAIHLHGAMGFTDECDIGHYMKRAVALNSALGQPEALRLQFLALERAA
ncbi:acyl-CoA dehydrogenase family protein [Falsigemmobacter faecalis]|uniref:Acyl-CoA dehydrogenase n=1 Tax=Falsigemmobacter faecalis TaxID=2488730 RepID=A0A3P3DGN6_9RHOB|nr:acyl-CoA dehydrogenase family protein [Falsigemmobacter faecalis]RRH73004.1 acyl-CoA dehydrogenase [Falsigemmobacter faecalis]